MKFHLHKWLPWSDPINTLNSGHKAQWRACKICNKTRHRVQRWDGQSKLSDIIGALLREKEHDRLRAYAEFMADTRNPRLDFTQWQERREAEDAA